jgi:hypothetical protein
MWWFLLIKLIEIIVPSPAVIFESGFPVYLSVALDRRKKKIKKNKASRERELLLSKSQSLRGSLKLKDD